MTLRLNSTALRVGALAALLVPASALAQDGAAETSPEAGTALPELVVTAQRRTEKLQDVPITVSTVSGAELATRQITNAVEIGRITPGVATASNTGGQAAAFSIRGVTLSDFNDGTEAPVAVYVDEGYLPNVQAQSFAIFDIDRVEILKGPQGTLFGRNSTGGVVNFIIAKPTATPAGYVNASYGRFNAAKIEGAVGGPLSGKLLGRASIVYDREDGWLENLHPTAPDLGGHSTIAGRLQLQADLADGLTARLSGSAFKQRMSTAPYNSIGTAPIRDPAGRVVDGYYTNGANSFGYVPPPMSKLQTNADFACGGCTGMNIYNGALHLDYDLGGVHLASVTDFIRVSKRLKLDAEVSPINFLDVAQNGQTESFTQEIRANGKAGNLTWSAGAYYLDILVNTQGGYLARANSIYAAQYAGYAVSGIDLDNIAKLRKHSASVFGQVDYEFLPRLTLTVGGRFIHEWQDYQFASSAYRNIDDTNLDHSVYLFTLQPSYSNSISNDLWTGRLGLNYKPSRDLMVYASVVRGVRGSGFNNKLPAGPPLAPAQFLYKPETLLAYEAGAKSTLLDGKLTLDGSVYYYDYKNYQAFLFLTAGGFIQNADATTYGGEIQASYRPTHNLRLTLNGSYNHSVVHDMPIAPGVARDTTPTFAPRRQMSASIDYTFDPELAGGQFTLSADVTATSSFFTNIRNFTSQKLSGYSLVDLQLTWKNTQGLTVTASVGNLFDKRYGIAEADLSTLCGCTEIGYGRPRRWTASVGYRF